MRLIDAAGKELPYDLRILRGKRNVERRESTEPSRDTDGIFGCSDEVLGAHKSGVNLEKRIAQVYQECRPPEEIEAAFDQLQSELDETIATRFAATRSHPSQRRESLYVAN